MNLPEDVIVDLLPAYFSGEASAATRAIVDTHFAAHPQFAQAMRAAQGAAGLPRIDAAGAADDGREAIRRVRKALRRRGLLIALAIFCSISPFTFMVKEQSLVYFMWRDAPAVAGCYIAVALAAWTGLWMSRRAAAA